MFRFIEPEVAGGLGKETLLDVTVHPPRVHKLHFEMDGWLGDDFLETFPVYIITERLKELVVAEGLTGMTFDHVTVSLSQLFLDLHPERSLPLFYWAKIIGAPLKDDFFMAPDHRLVISEKAYQIVTQLCISNALFEDIDEID